MMAIAKLFVLGVCLVAFTTAQQGPSSQASAGPIANQILDGTNPEVKLLDYKNEQNKDGYFYSYQTSDNSNQRQEGIILNPGTDNEELVVMGRYTYRIGNTEIVVEYTADKNGYRPQVRVSFLPVLSISSKLLGNLSG